MAELRPHYIDVDLKKNTQYNVPVVTQNDTATHFIIRVTDDGLTDPELLDAYQEITMTSQRPDGESFYLTGTRIPGTNEIEFHLGTDETAFSGSVLASLQFYLVEDASRYTSAQFRYDVKKDLTKNYTPTQREETLVEVVLRDGPVAIQEAKDAKFAVDGALVDLEQDKTAAIGRLDEVTEENKTVFRQPVNTFADLATTYPNPEHGTTVRVTSEAASYRYSDGTWVKTDEYNPTAIDQVTAQLAETGEDLFEIKKGVSNKVKQAIVTFTSDDGNVQDYIKLKPVFEAKGVPCTLGIISSRLNGSGNLSKNQIAELQNLGWEIASHTESHLALGDLTLEAVEHELKKSKETLIANGFNVKNFIYPFGSSNKEVRKLVKKYYRSALGVDTSKYGDKLNGGALRTFNLRRVSFGSYYPTQHVDYPPNDSYEFYKLMVDDAVANNAWLIFMMHPNAETHDETQQFHLSNLIDYIKSLNVPILNVDDALDRVENIVDVGDYTNSDGDSYTIVDSTGEMYSNSIDKMDQTYAKKNATGITINTPPSGFPSDKVTITQFTNSDSGAGFPETSVGTLETYFFNRDMVFQVWNPQVSSNVYKRHSIGFTSDWSDFKKVNEDFKHVVIPTKNAYTGATPISEYPKNSITTSFFDSGGSAGFPTGAGIVTTYNVGTNAYQKQELKAYGKDVVWERSATVGGAWGAWVIISQNMDIYPMHRVNPTRNTPMYNGESLIIAFPDKAITTFYVSGSNSAGLPGTGIVTTYRMGEYGWDRQEFRKYLSNELWSRFVALDGSWTSWVKISAV